MVLLPQGNVLWNQQQTGITGIGGMGAVRQPGAAQSRGSGEMEAGRGGLGGGAWRATSPLLILMVPPDSPGTTGERLLAAFVRGTCSVQGDFVSPLL